MKKFLFLIIIIPFIIPSCKDKDKCNPISSCQIPSSLSKHVLAFYPFTNGSIDDFSGNNHHLSNSSSAHATSDRANNPSCAFEFENLTNSAELLTTSNTSFLDNLSEFTVSLWYEPLETSLITRYEGLIERDTIGNRLNPTAQWSIALYDCRKALFGRTSAVWDNHLFHLNCTKEYIERTNKWHHLVATYNSDGIEMTLYRNGVLQDQTLGDWEDNKSYDQGDLFIGKGYTGKIDDILIFDKSLNQTQIDSLFKMTPCCSN
jgi:hypothetical protein